MTFDKDYGASRRTSFTLLHALLNPQIWLVGSALKKIYYKKKVLLYLKQNMEISWIFRFFLGCSMISKMCEGCKKISFCLRSWLAFMYYLELDTKKIYLVYPILILLAITNHFEGVHFHQSRGLFIYSRPSSFRKYLISDLVNITTI